MGSNLYFFILVKKGGYKYGISSPPRVWFGGVSLLTTPAAGFRRPPVDLTLESAAIGFSPPHCALLWIRGSVGIRGP